MHQRILKRLADNYIDEARQKKTPDLATSWGERFPTATKGDKLQMKQAILAELKNRGATRV